MNSVVKKIIFVCLIACFAIPAIETNLRLIPVDGLKGAFFRTPKPEFTYTDLFEARFQPEYEKYVNDTIGLRSFFIRIRNQIDYTCFNTLHTYDIVVDKKGILNASTHYDHHLGKGGVNQMLIDNNCTKLQKIKTEFAKINKQIVILFAPCKGWYGLKDAPYWYNTKKAGPSYYDLYLQKLKEKQIEYIDFNEYLNTCKLPYKAFTDYGIHWSKAAAFWAFDSIAKYLEKTRAIDMPNVIFDEYGVTDIPIPPDADLTASLNLFQDYPIKEMFYYPRFHMESEANKTKPSPLFISDSFFWNVIYDGFLEHQYNNMEFWYYNKTAYIKDKMDQSVESLNFIDEASTHDVFFILSTEINLPELGWGVIDNLYNNLDKITKLYAQMIRIKQDKVWCNEIAEKSKANNISFETQLIADSKYVIDNEEKNRK